MVSKRKIGICLIVIVILSTVVIGCILSSYNNPDFFWGYFAIGASIVFSSLSIIVYMLSEHFKKTNIKLGHALRWISVYLLVSIIGVILYAILNSIGAG